jgi:hypothetical protein
MKGLSKLTVGVALVSLATIAAAAPVRKAAPATRPHPVAGPTPAPTPPPPPAPLPIFEFKGENTETDANIAGRHCEHGKGAVWSCYGYDTLAGINVFMGRSYNNLRLYMVIATFDEGSFDTVLQAMIAKYGKPDAVETKKWQSRGGATFDNQIASWRFKGGGKLSLESMGSKVGESRLFFDSEQNSPPAEAPKVDF